MKNQTKSLDEVFELIRLGKRQEGVKLLYALHYNKLYGIAFSFVKNEAKSEDIVHNSIYKLLNIKTDLFPKAYVSTWLYTFIKNEALMFLRKEKPTIPIDEITNIGKEEQKIENYVNMDAYYSMIKNLSEERQQIVTLKVLGGYTHKEIAQMLGKPVGTIQWVYNTSIKKLKYILTTFISSIVLVASIITAKLTMYFYNLYRFNNNSEDEVLKGGHFDFSIIVFVGLLLILVVLFVFFLKNPKKSQQKPKRKASK